MTEELEKLRDYIHAEKPALDTLEGVVSDIVVKNRSDRELLIKLCIRTGVLQSFIQESTHDIIFINQCKTKLINDHFFSANAAEKAITYCKFLSLRKWNFITVENVKVTLDDIKMAEGFEDHKKDKINDSSDKSGWVDLKNRDELFNDVSRFVVERQMSLTSAIQRKYLIGYNRAGRIIDQLEAAGIVGKNNGSKPRQILIQDVDSLEQILMKINS